jgi:mRNA-degrading endonuclease RelE of RelBE toxin-antitoxin system
MPYQVLVADSVISFLDRLDPSERNKILKRLKLLEENPKSVGEPRGKFWVLKVGSSGYRLAFRIIEENKTLRVAAIEKRKLKGYERFYD